MSNFLADILNIYSNAELLQLGAVVVISLLGCSAIYFWISRQKMLTLMPWVSGILFIVLYTVFTLVAHLYIEQIDNGYPQIGLITGLLLVLLNISIYVVEYFRELRYEKFDIDHVNRSHFRATLNSGVMILLLGISFSFFSTPQLGQAVFLTSVASLLTLIFNHLVIIRVLQDK